MAPTWAVPGLFCFAVIKRHDVVLDTSVFNCEKGDYYFSFFYDLRE